MQNVNEIEKLSGCSGKRLGNTPFKMTVNVELDIDQKTCLPIKPELYTQWYRSCTTTQEGITRRPRAFISPEKYTLRYQEFLLKSALDIKKANAGKIKIIFPNPEEYANWHKQKMFENSAYFATYTQQPTPEEYKTTIYPKLIEALKNLKKTPQEADNACSTILGIFQGDNNNQAQSNNNETGITIDQSTATKTEKAGKNVFSRAFKTVSNMLSWSNNNETGITIDQSTATKTEKAGKNVLIIVGPQNATLTAPKTFINGNEITNVRVGANQPFVNRDNQRQIRPVNPAEYDIWFKQNYPQGLPVVDPDAPKGNLRILTPPEFAIWHARQQNINPQNNAQPKPTAPTVNLFPEVISEIVKILATSLTSHMDNMKTAGNKRVAEDMEPKINNNNDTTGEPNAKRKKPTSPVGENPNLMFAQDNSKPSEKTDIETEEDEKEQETKNSPGLNKSPRSDSK